MSARHALVVALALVALVTVLAPGAARAPAAPVATGGVSAAIVVASSKYGPILFDGRGYALYAFTRDPRRRTTCYGACSKAWPPFLVRRRPAAGKGAKAALVGTVRRRGGKLQATYGGRPLYYYVHDPKGDVLCQDVVEFGGTWLVLRGTGALVR
jgi:predicted lipoprotein with Yx(FWY)xxD motif